MNRFTVEEICLISIYLSDTKHELIQKISDAIPFVDEDMKKLAIQTIAKIDTLSLTEYVELSLWAADETLND